MIVRLRFSTRLLLTAIAIVAIVLYFGYVRPTALAERFVSSVMREDFAAASSMVGPASWDGTVGSQVGGKPDSIYAEALPREWGDVWRCQRRVILRLSRHSGYSGGRLEWTEDNDVITGPAGARITSAPRQVGCAVPIPVLDAPPANIDPSKDVRLEPGAAKG